MKKYTLIVALIILLSGVALAQTPADDARTGIQMAYAQSNTAFLQHDLTRFMSYFAADYRVIDEKGAASDKSQTQRHYRDQLSQIKSMQSRYTLQDFQPTAQGTLVTMKMHTGGVGEKRVLFVKVKGTFVNDLLVRDLWVATPQGWRLKHRQTLLDQTHIHPG